MLARPAAAALLSLVLWSGVGAATLAAAPAYDRPESGWGLASDTPLPTVEPGQRVAFGSAKTRARASARPLVDGAGPSTQAGRIRSLALALDPPPIASRPAAGVDGRGTYLRHAVLLI